MAARHLAASRSSGSWRRAAPALLTRMSIGPISVSMRSMTCAAACGSDRSAAYTATLWPLACSCARACSRPCGSRATMATYAPSAANALATARPMPLLPPVTTVILPFSFRFILRSQGTMAVNDTPSAPRHAASAASVPLRREPVRRHQAAVGTRQAGQRAHVGGAEFEVENAGIVGGPLGAQCLAQGNDIVLLHQPAQRDLGRGLAQALGDGADDRVLQHLAVGHAVVGGDAHSQALRLGAHGRLVQVGVVLDLVVDQRRGAQRGRLAHQRGGEVADAD